MFAGFEIFDVPSAICVGDRLGMSSGIHAVSAFKRMDPGTSLLAERAALNLSREVFAAECGLSPRTIYAIEVEGVRPQRATCAVIEMTLARLGSAS
jgi:DNA-binding XRE family transcriptional regulator